MRFEFTPEEQAFRSDLAALLDDALPDDWTGPADESNDRDWQLYVDVRRALAERGWLTMAWPAEHGGSDASPMTSLIFSEEIAYRRAPGNDRFGTRMIGPTLIRHGTEAQKRRFLPPIAKGLTQWCQGYSEPDTGSDLASLKTRAVEDGDEFVITGAKIWTTLAHRADWMFLLARTDPEAQRHHGITLFLCDMSTPGVTVKPIINMAGYHSFNEVIFDGVRVPRENIVGGLHNGWRTGLALLNFERSGIDYVAWARRTLDDITEYAATTRAPGGGRLIDDPVVSARLVELGVEIDAARLMTYQVAWLQGKGEVPSVEPAMSKLTATEVNQRVHDFAVELLGMYGPLAPGSHLAEFGGRLLKLQLYYTSGPILAGTNEIQRNIIAARGLGLPRE